MTIKLNSIIPAPWNTRGSITPESVKELAASIEEQGLINPITLWRDADGAWLCIAGNRRLAALRALHTKDYDGELPKDHYNVFGGDLYEAKMVTVTENLQREDVSPIEEAALVSECLDAGMTAEAIAAKTGRSASWVNRRRKLIALDEVWRNCTTLPVDALEKIAAYPADVQKKVAKVRPNPLGRVAEGKEGTRGEGRGGAQGEAGGGGRGAQTRRRNRREAGGVEGRG